MDNHMTPVPVRHDRKYFVSLALHEAVKCRLKVDPDRVLGLGIAGANKILPNARGDARGMLHEWLRVLSERDLSTVETLLTEDSEHAAEMRNMAVFLGVLSQAERRSVLDAVYERAEYEL